MVNSLTSNVSSLNSFSAVNGIVDVSKVEVLVSGLLLGNDTLDVVFLVATEGSEKDFSFSCTVAKLIGFVSKNFEVNVANNKTPSKRL